ncbi:hypothetical protein Tsubulata_041269 [Turnera subulata]|uniref:Uncharacterized protein n=1 Tax=Turnera subulata TaxID=218843 RepID=A0A9Q0F2S5_9ROSI|nr:hypothetical protein Tsubulata_041269 [Turnera subulata]
MVATGASGGSFGSGGGTFGSGFWRLRKTWMDPARISPNLGRSGSSTPMSRAPPPRRHATHLTGRDLDGSNSIRTPLFVLFLYVMYIIYDIVIYILDQAHALETELLKGIQLQSLGIY